jgi:hypothetical protein
MLYARLNDAGQAFEPQRNLITRSTALDGGGSVAASGGSVFVAWHAAPLAPEGQPTPAGEAFRRVFIARSRDGGATFEAETPISPENLGACGCCGLKAFIDETGALGVLFRSAQWSVDRDMYWLRQESDGHFSDHRLDAWQLNACPMTTAAAATSGQALIMAWETAEQIRIATHRPGSDRPAPISAPGPAGRRKYPAVAINLRGEVVLAWTEGMSWSTGGSLRWQVYTASLEPIAGASGQADGVPPWSLVSAAADADGTFTVFY